MEIWNVRLLRDSLQCYISVHENARTHEVNVRSSSHRNVRGDDHSVNRNKVSQPFLVFSVKEAILMIAVINTQHFVFVNNSCHCKVDASYV